METTLTTQVSYRDTEFEIFFASLEKEQLALAEIQARQHGLAGKPINVRQYQILMIAPIKSVIQKALDWNFSRHQPVSNLAIGKELRLTAIDKAGLLQKEKNEKEKKLLINKHALNELRPRIGNPLSPKLKIGIPLALAVGEGALVYANLQYASYPFIMILFLSSVIALSAGTGLHVAADWIMKAPHKHAKLHRHIIVIGVASIVAAALGIWRSQTFNQASSIQAQVDLDPLNTPAHYISAWPFIAVSLIAFIVALSFELKYWMSSEHQECCKKYNDKKKEVAKGQQEQIILQKKIDATKATMTKESGSILLKQEYAAGNEYRLTTLAMQIIRHYESVNCEFRNEAQCPVFYGEPINFDFKLYFTNFFTPKKFHL